MQECVCALLKIGGKGVKERERDLKGWGAPQKGGGSHLLDVHLFYIDLQFKNLRLV